MFWNLRRIQSQLTIITNIVFAQGLPEIPNLDQYGGFGFKPICARTKISIIRFQKAQQLEDTGKFGQVANEINVIASQILMSGDLVFYSIKTEGIKPERICRSVLQQTAKLS